ncbi:Eukaryotic translation initiation factor 3 subunit C [Cardamine amara subsp. amara]|uniref:Eukaryotic translation initiation factor 3 subunit C n=1 Tax=Cardamine amara subsp. amara TaxID=228776 RepID=A0ABD0ZDN4_CARAN
MTSRFFAKSGSESEDETDFEEGIQKVEENDINQYLDKEGIDTKRVTKPTKNKRFEKMTNTVELRKNAMEMNDWVSIQEKFDLFNKQFEKVMTTTKAVKTVKAQTLYIKTLEMLQDFVTEEALDNNNNQETKEEEDEH